MAARVNRLGNAWAGEQTGAGGVSAVVDLDWRAQVSLLIDVSGPTVLTWDGSLDGQAFYPEHSVSADAANLRFAHSHTVGYRFLRLRSSNNVLATVTVTAAR